MPRAVGIDLGMTNSVTAAVEGRAAKRSSLMPKACAPLFPSWRLSTKVSGQLASWLVGRRSSIRRG